MLRVASVNILAPKALGKRYFSPATSQILVKNSLLRALKREAPLDIHPEVQHALYNHKPIVALETALVTNGMPAPTNLEVGRKLEEIVRKEGAVPATIGIVNGRIKIGMDDEDLVRLADKCRAKDELPVKVSRRDIGSVLALKKDGGTTICSTLVFASLAGIKVIATGGLGGVHRGGENSLDISADLQELSRCPVAVVSCGVKSILDIKRTLEYLETLGVPVVTYGSTTDFPAFYSGSSGFKSPWRVDNPRVAAEMLLHQWKLGLENGTLFAAPIPEAYLPQGAQIQAAIEQAIAESEQNGMNQKGNDVTPWLLGRVVELTGGKSLESNIALLENTAVIGTRIAVEYALLQDHLHGRSGTAPSSVADTVTSSQHNVNQSTNVKREAKPHQDQSPPKLVVVGASAIDITASADGIAETKAGLVDLRQTTTPGAVTLTVGGVARNIAEAAHRVLSSSSTDGSSATALLSPVGDDGLSKILLSEQRRLGMRTDGLFTIKGETTAVCNMLLTGSGALIGGVADMDITQTMDESKIVSYIKGFSDSIKLVAIDANSSSRVLQSIIRECSVNKIDMLFEPTSVTKSTTIINALKNSYKENTKKSPNEISYCTPNVLELKQLYEAICSEETGIFSSDSWWAVVDGLNLADQWRNDLQALSRQSIGDTADKGSLEFIVSEGIAQMATSLLPIFQNLVIKCGDRGVIVVMRISGEAAMHSTWSSERSDPARRCIIAKGSKTGDIVVLKHYPAIHIKDEEIINVTGAGDSLVGTLCSGIAMDPTAFDEPTKLDALVQASQEAAVLSLHSVRAVSPLLGSAGTRREGLLPE